MLARYLDDMTSYAETGCWNGEFMQSTEGSIRRTSSATTIEDSGLNKPLSLYPSSYSEMDAL
jgi:hypothetical protein